MLIPKTMAITDVFRVHYVRTTMMRDALFVDVDMGGKTIRLCTTHLEFLTAIPPKRPQQLAEAAEYLHKAYAGILAGDLNAIQDFHRFLPSRNNLKDAYLETGYAEDDPAGMTWGPIAATLSRRRHGLTQMDKMLFCGAVQVEDFRRLVWMCRSRTKATDRHWPKRKVWKRVGPPIILVPKPFFVWYLKPVSIVKAASNTSLPSPRNQSMTYG